MISKFLIAWTTHDFIDLFIESISVVWDLCWMDISLLWAVSLCVICGFQTVSRGIITARYH